MARSWPGRAKHSVARRVAAGYALLATLAVGLALALRDGVPWLYPSPWLTLGPTEGALLSAAGGLAFALTLIVLTRVAVARFQWAQRLHLELRPVARDLSLGDILLLAGLSSLGEELLFRGLLAPWLGVIGSALLFGLAHQIRGPSRWVWAGWATVVGLGLGALFAATGSLVGPLIAHAVVNAKNLSYLRDHDPVENRPLAESA
jgi:membrane protease YdiL (CAAX protease family)